MTNHQTRRDFLSTSAAIGAATLFVNPGAVKASRSANEKLNIAAVGTKNRALANINGCKTENIVALCDIDSDFLDITGKDYPNARKYRDFRVMLEKEEGKIDAVLVGTPDHCHAPAAAMALRMKKHVYCEKPLTHTVFEARTLANLAKENNLVTQMGTQIHAGNNYRRVVELVQSGAIGDVKRVHVWVPAVYNQGVFKTAEKPANVDWDLWLGPAPERSYSSDVHPFKWRNFWDFGTGGLGDFGCHYMDLVHWALDLRGPEKIAASGSPVDPISCPDYVVADYHYPARGKKPPVHLTWYDGGKKPEMLKTLKDKNGKPINPSSGQLFIGDKGMILSNYSNYTLFPADKFVDFTPPEESIPNSIGHHQEWINAIKTDGTTTCNFDYSGALTEAVLLGTVAYRSGETLDWDAAHLKVKNSPAAQSLIHKEYRKGWTL
ncbi:MAG: Gfo/Idh/MocA family oxidoreductase [Planctomycetaceae bacterium]|nr:Gfo/Idh/MocA family oxidoreductase [Planctomycetaceae bacterium]